MTRRFTLNFAVVLAAAFAIDAGVARAQVTEERESALALARAVVTRFPSADSLFDRLYPFEPGRAFARRARPAATGIAHVAAERDGRAVLVLSAAHRSESPGSETLVASSFSGLHLAERRDSGWVLTRRLPLDSGNAILAHRLTVSIEPGHRVHVVDTMTVRVGVAHGIAFRLHPRAVLQRLRLDGRQVPFHAGGGVLWVGADSSAREQRIALSYTLPIAADTVDGEPGRFFADYGHLRHYYYWHPFFDLGSTSDLADISVRVTVPARYSLTTSLPQTERLAGAARVIVARSTQATKGISLAYDVAWKPVTVAGDGFRVQAFISPDAPTPADSFAAAVSRTHRLLASRYGNPAGSGTAYYAVAHLRSLPATQAFRDNDLVAMGAQGMSHAPTGGALPSATLAHEVSHAWTAPTGEAEAWLMEGWAAYAESEAIAAELGTEAESAYWERMRAAHYRTGAEGRWPVIGDSARRIVSYRKGPWIWRSLRHALGDSAFVRGMRAHVAIPRGQPAGLDELIHHLSVASGRDVRPLLLPWLTERSLPDVVARLDGARVQLTQVGPVTPLLALGVDLTTAAGIVRRIVDLVDSTAVLEVNDVGAIASVRVDPEHHYLLRRHWGDTVRVTLPASAAPEATRIELAGELRTGPRVPAQRVGDRWEVELVASEGRYEWFWMADGKMLRSGVAVVAPRVPLESPHP